MDRITNSLLEAFIEDFDLVALEQDRAFEQFSNHCVVSQEYGGDFDPADVTITDEPDTGLDGVAIVVNGHLVGSVEEVDDIIAVDRQLRVKFVFIQSKTSNKFEGAAIGTFGFGVFDFFSEQPKLPRSATITSLAEVQNHLYVNSKYMTQKRPSCRLFYVTTGKWIGDEPVQARCDSVVSDLDQTNLFDEVTLAKIDARALQKLYHATKTSVSIEIQFPDCTVLPQIEGVPEAYIGTLPAGEFLKLVADDAGNIRRSLFYENVRGFQGGNRVNQAIADTIESGNQDQFVLLNNGVTIVAKSLNKIGTKFRLEDFQVVNGCQTSHVLYEHRDRINDTLHVPLKLIVSDSDSVTTAVIKATNSQTEVKGEQLQALSEFQKQLEQFFGTFKGDQRLHYERRSNQYGQSPGIEKVRIVTIANQMRAFASMFLDEPHRAYRYYGTLHKEIGGRLFSDKHRHMPYYTSAYALYRIEGLIRNGVIGRGYRPYRYHLVAAFRVLATAKALPGLGSKAMDSYCAKLNKLLWDSDQSSKIFQKAVDVVDGVGKEKSELNRDLAKTQSFTEAVLQAAAG